MSDFIGSRLKRATPGQPVEVLGFDGVPEAGEIVRVVENEWRARQLAGERANRLKTEALARRSGRKVSLEDVFKLAQEGTVKELGLVVKADVAGSLEAIEDEIAKLPQQEVKVNIIHRGVGGINESDVMLASASEGVVLAFNVRPIGDARQIAEREGVEIRSYAVIYRAIEELRAAMQGIRFAKRNGWPSESAISRVSSGSSFHTVSYRASEPRMTIRQSGRSRTRRSFAVSAVREPSGLTAAISNPASVCASTASSGNSGLMPIDIPAGRTGTETLAREARPDGSSTSTSISAFTGRVTSGALSIVTGSVVCPSASVSGISRSRESGAYVSSTRPMR